MKTPLKYISRIIPIVLGVMIMPMHKGEAVSLWLKGYNNEKSLFVDKVASQIGDILTITFEIGEESYKKTLDTKNADKTATITNTITSILYQNSDFLKHNGTLPSTGTSGINKFTGKGDLENKLSLTNISMSVTIVDRLPNGNLVFEGIRNLYYSEERQYMVLRGVVRKYDIMQNNTVLAKHISDLEFTVLDEGALHDAQRKGWFTKLYDFINPF